MAISLIFMFVVVAFPHAIGLEVIVSSYNFYTQNAVVNNPLIGIVNSPLPDNAPSVAWYATTYAGRQDGQYASATISRTAVYTGYGYVFDTGMSTSGASGSNVGNTAYLTTQLYNFSIPTQAIPTGLIAQAITHSHLTTVGSLTSASCGVTDYSVRLIAYGKYAGAEHATQIVWPKEADSAFQWGGSNDQWGISLTQDMIMAPDFGVAISGHLSTSWTTNLGTAGSFAGNTIGTSCTVYVDMVSLTLLYKLPVYTTVTSSGTTVTTATTPQTVTVTGQGATSTVTTSQTATATLTTATTNTFVTTPATVTMTYSPTTYTWTQPGGTTTTTTQGSSQSTVTLSTTSAPTSPLPSVFGFSANQEYSLAGGLLTFLSGFGMSLLGLRRR